MSWDNRVYWSRARSSSPSTSSSTIAMSRASRAAARGLHLYPGLRGPGPGRVSLEWARWGSGGAGLLPDGNPFDCPARDPLPAPLDVPAALRDSLVSVALSVRRPGGRGSTSGRPGRTAWRVWGG